jgi:hypothetical protein
MAQRKPFAHGIPVQITDAEMEAKKMARPIHKLRKTMRRENASEKTSAAA